MNVNDELLDKARHDILKLTYYSQYIRNPQIVRYFETAVNDIANELLEAIEQDK